MSKTAPNLALPILRLNSNDARPLYRQLYEQLGAAIRAGQLKPGARLPSTRALAHELDVSRTTTVEVYRDLAAEGYIESRTGIGTCVTRTLPDRPYQLNVNRRNQPARAIDDRPSQSRHLDLLAELARTPWFAQPGDLRPFELGTPALAEAPIKTWARVLARSARQTPHEALGALDPVGDRALREAIAAYLSVARAVRCDADQVLITGGGQAGMALAIALVLTPGDSVWVEEPGYFLAQTALRMLGARLVPVPVDDEGLHVSAGCALGPAARLAVVTPSHQFPLGVTMSHTRRMALLSWAQHSNAWIIEDDYDSEFRYGGRPVPALQGLDDSGRVIYVGTFSKALFPALRLGFLVVPPALMQSAALQQRVLGSQPGLIEQRAMAAFMDDGYFDRHIRRMRALYTERRDCLCEVAAEYLDGLLRFENTHSGLHLAAWLPIGANDREYTRCAVQNGVRVYPLSDFRLGDGGRPGVALGFAAFEPRAITGAVQTLARAWAK